MILMLIAATALQASSPMQPPQVGGVRSDPATAQTAALPIAMRGTPVVNSNGNAVGTVVAAEGGTVVVDTGAQRMAYPASRFTVRNGSLVFDLTQGQVEGEALSSQGDMRSRLLTVLIPGAAVRDPSGNLIGTIEGVGATGVTVSSGSTRTAVPASAFSMDASGGLVIPVSLAEFSAPR